MTFSLPLGDRIAPPAPLEKDVQRGVTEFYQQLGCVVHNLSQGYRPGGKRHGTTRQTKGLADLWVLWPARGLAWWHETKKADGVLSDEQLTFYERNTACGIAVVVGGTRDAAAFIDWVRRAGGPTGGTVPARDGDVIAQYRPKPKRPKKTKVQPILCP